MSRITKALEKAEKDRSEQKKHLRQSDMFNGRSGIKEGVMKNSWLIWVFIGGVIMTVFVAFNYEGGQRTMPLSEIFPEEETYPVDIEYEFVEETVNEEPRTIAAVQEVAQIIEPVAESVKTVAPITVQAVEIIEEKIEALASTSAKETVKIDLVKIPFTIQVASFKKQSMADGLRKELESSDYAAFVASRNLGAKGTWYRVYVGQYESKVQAETALNNIKKSYASSFVISPK